MEGGQSTLRKISTNFNTFQELMHYWVGDVSLKMHHMLPSIMLQTF